MNLNKILSLFVIPLMIGILPILDVSAEIDEQHYLRFIYELGETEIFVGNVLVLIGSKNINNLSKKDIELIKKSDILLKKCLNDLGVIKPPIRFKKLHFLYNEIFTLQKEGIENLLLALDKNLQIDKRQEYLNRYDKLFEYAEEKMNEAKKLMNSLQSSGK